MIIVTGNRRSGTSLWMQILQQGGFQIFGSAFPAHWKQIEAANKKGFFESKLVQGINYHTNPDPKSGRWIPPQQVENFGVKIFADGLIKTDFAYIGKVIVTIRDWQESESSQLRLKKIMSEQQDFKHLHAEPSLSVELPAGYDWWSANFGLLQDMMTRRYPSALFSYNALLKDPHKIISRVFTWLGQGDVDKAVTVVEASLQTQKNVKLTQVNHDHAEVFDELYQALDQSQQIQPDFLKKLVATNNKIINEIKQLKLNA